MQLTFVSLVLQTLSSVFTPGAPADPTTVETAAYCEQQEPQEMGTCETKAKADKLDCYAKCEYELFGKARCVSACDDAYAAAMNMCKRDKSPTQLPNPGQILPGWP